MPKVKQGMLILLMCSYALFAHAQIMGIGPIEPVTRLHMGFQFTEGPAADAQGNVYFSDVQRARIHKIDTQGNLTTFLENQTGVNGLMFDRAGRLIACQTGRLVAINVATKEVTVLATRFENTNFQGPNDLAIDRQGNIYFTDRTGNAVYFVKPDNSVQRLGINLNLPNGVLLSLDEKTLYVLSSAAMMQAYPVNAPGQLGEPKAIALAGNGGGDGLTIDTQGNLYVTRPTSSFIQVLKPSGESLGTISFPEAPANCVFGGPDMKTLYVTARTSVYTAKLQTIGYRMANATASLSAASFIGDRPLARGGIVSVFGSGLATATQVSNELPLPQTLAGTAVKVVDSQGMTWPAGLFFVSAEQINCELPGDAATGAATLLVTTGNQAIFTEGIQISNTAPGIFTANANGQGVPAGFFLGIRNGQQVLEPIARFDQASNRFVPIPLELPENSPAFLVLFGTGARNIGLQDGASVQINDEPANLAFIGAQGRLAGLDQLNIEIPRTLIGRGEVELVLTVGTRNANRVRISVK